MIKAAERVSLINEYYFSKKLKEIARMEEKGFEVINLGIGNPDLPPDNAVKEALVQANKEERSHTYQSYVGIVELREAFAQWYKTHFGVALNAQNEVLPLLGSKEGVMHISMAYVNAGERVLIPNPGYPTYTAVSNLVQAKLIFYELEAENGWLPNLEKIEASFQKGVKLMWLNYPHMPTGAVANKVFLEKLVQLATTYGVLLVNDNPYSFILNNDLLSILSIKGAKECALELNSLSKSHNMPGWRVGCVLGSQQLLEPVLKVKTNMDSGMFLPVQKAAVQALKAPLEWYKSLNKQYEKRRKLAWQLLESLGCQIDKECVGLFVLGKIPSEYQNGFEMSDKLLEEYQLFITPGGVFGSQADSYLRISLCANEETLKKVIKRIQP